MMVRAGGQNGDVDLWRAAAANNACWCDLVARSHGLRTEFSRHAWTCLRRTPPFYPDAVTLVPHPPARELLPRIDTSPGCSVKDSFAALDLRPHGFRILFRAAWIAQADAGPVAVPSHPRWRRIEQLEDLVRWQQARPDRTEPRDLFRADLLGHDQVAVLAAEHEGQIVAGAILTTSQGVAGLSNLFTRPGADPWPGCLALARSLFPGHTVVGYESAAGLASAEQHGFQVVGRLRVWTNDSRHRG